MTPTRLRKQPGDGDARRRFTNEFVLLAALGVLSLLVVAVVVTLALLIWASAPFDAVWVVLAAFLPIAGIGIAQLIALRRRR